MTLKMKKIMIQQYMGVLATLATLVLSITLYSYGRDQTVVNDKIDNEIVERKQADINLKTSIKEKVSAQEFKEYKDGIKALLDYIQANDKEKRELELKIIELTKD